MKFPKISLLSAAITIVILVGLGIFSKTFSVQKVDLVRESLSDFPKQLGDYQSRDIDIGEAALGVLAPTEVLMRAYTNAAGEVITLYIPFFGVQNDRSRIHSPKSCMVGGGYRFVSVEPFTLKYGGKDVTVNRVITKRGSDKQVVLYWIHSRGRILTNEYVSKLYLMWDAVATHRSDGALVRCIAQVERGESEEEATNRVAAFAQMVMDQAPAYLPE